MATTLPVEPANASSIVPTTIPATTIPPGERMAAIRIIRDRIIHDFNPVSIILFGSMARGDHNKYSDIDIMVVMPEGANTRVAGRTIYDVHNGLGDVDMIVTTPSILEAKSQLRGSAQRMALLEGVELYGNQILKYHLDYTNDVESGSVFMENALDDLQTATENYSDARNQVKVRAYYSQQAAEKAMKAALAWSGIEPIHVHKLEDLYSRVPTNWGINVSKTDLESLTEMNTKSRYGNIPVTKYEADSAYELASYICNIIYSESVRRRKI